MPSVSFHRWDSPDQRCENEPAPVQWARNSSTRDVFGIKEWGPQNVSQAGLGAGGRFETPAASVLCLNGNSP